MKSHLKNQTSFNFLHSFIPVKTGSLLILLIASLLSISSLYADTRYRVKSSDSVKRIIAKEYPDRSLSQEQLMIEIFFRNPRAFIKNDINRLKRGYRLVLPSEENIQPISHQEAKSILKRGTKKYLSDQQDSQQNIEQSSEESVAVSNAASELLSEFDLSGEDLEILGAGQSTVRADVVVEEKETSSSENTDTAQVESQSHPSQRITEKKRRDTRSAVKTVSNKELLNSRQQLKEAKNKLSKIEQERQKLKEQLERLTQEKHKSDIQLNSLDTKLQESIKLNSQLKSDLDANLTAKKNTNDDISNVGAGDKVELISPEVIAAEKTNIENDIIAQDKKQKILEKQVEEKTQKLKESNTFFQQKLQEARSELAENTRENIALERQLNAFKKQSNINAVPAESGAENLPTREGENSVAGDIGKAKYSEKSLDDSSVSSSEGLGKFLWLLPLLALFAGLWWVLRRFLGGNKSIMADSSEDNTFATNAFDADDGFDEEYEEVSLETSIKLDVARAYIEADDRESAREMLQEVINEGNEEQQEEAKAILEACPRTD